jgi:UDP-N-acetylmuramate dehydrogenase
MLDDKHKQFLQQLLSSQVRFDEPMAGHTSFHIGGPTDILAEPRTEEQLKELLQWTVNHNMPYTIIGDGTNLLVRDGGIRGVTIRLRHLPAQVRWQTAKNLVKVSAKAGVPTRRLCALALRHGWQGLLFALGIPGTLGGAITMNAGTGLGSMADVLASVTVMTAHGDIMHLGKKKLAFAYRAMTLPENLAAGGLGRSPVLLGADFKLTLGDRAGLREQARDIMLRRVKGQPVWQASAGCFFRNPSPAMPAGRLIDQAGLKGAAVGDAQVSLRHANFIVNGGRATAADVLQLKEMIEQAVWKRFGVRLEPEVRIVGQDKDA